MAEVINMPKMSDTMTEGVIVSWLKKVGDDIKPGDILAEVETDKATMELENYVKGTLLHIGIPEGGSVPVDSLIAIVGQKGEDISALLNGASAKPTLAEPSAVAAPAEIIDNSTAPVANATPAATVAATNTEDGRIKASPLAKSVAKEKGIDLSQIAGSGDNGRIIKNPRMNWAISAPCSTPSSVICRR
jgi:pyruvate dehydrogenase E2 component (dihydrolipoamide acetyltransferase)